MNSEQSTADQRRLRLYVARSTPNSLRAEHNLVSAMTTLADGGASLNLEVIDVFAQPKRAITDGVIVTPTLIAWKAGRRTTMMGDLTDTARLTFLLEDLTGEA